MAVEHVESEHGTIADNWTEISQRETTLTWFAAHVKPGSKETTAEIIGKGTGGLSELREFLGEQDDKIIFGLLRVTANDKSNSARQKFVYYKFLGSAIKVMEKAKLAPVMSHIDGCFPVKHLTCDLDSTLSGFGLEDLAREFLRVGGAHKPDSYDFGPDQHYECE
jgi:hypothetical protein